MHEPRICCHEKQALSQKWITLNRSVQSALTEDNAAKIMDVASKISQLR